MAREVVVVGHGGAVGMELMSACEVLELANACRAEAGRPPAYRIQVMSLDGGPLRLFAGVDVATRSLRRSRGAIDTLVDGGKMSALVDRRPRDEQTPRLFVGREAELELLKQQGIEALAKSILAVPFLRNTDDQRTLQLSEVLVFLERRVNAMLEACGSAPAVAESRAPSEPSTAGSEQTPTESVAADPAAPDISVRCRLTKRRVRTVIALRSTMWAAA